MWLLSQARFASCSRAAPTLHLDPAQPPFTPIIPPKPNQPNRTNDDQVAGVAVRGVAPLCDVGEAAAAWALEVLLPRLLLAIPVLYLCLLRLTHRFPVRVYVGAHPLMRAVVKRCPSFQRDYRPPMWACGAWAQAVVYLFRSWRNRHLRGFVREVIRLPDGEHVSLFWMAPPGKVRDAMVKAAGGDIEELQQAATAATAAAAATARAAAAGARAAARAAGAGAAAAAGATATVKPAPAHHHQPMSHGHGHGSQPPPDAASAAAAAAADPVIESLSRSLPADGETPIVVICHGVFQNAADLYEFCAFLTDVCGYVACVFNRRGNDMPLSRAKFNTVGDQEVGGGKGRSCPCIHTCVWRVCDGTIDQSTD